MLPFCLRDHRVGDVVDVLRIWPTPRTTADWAPMLTVLPPTLRLALFSACKQLGEGQLVGNELGEIDLDLVDLGLAAPAGHIDDAWECCGTGAAGSSPAACADPSRL